MMLQPHTWRKEDDVADPVTAHDTISTAQLAATVELACRAPSLHNSQPWRWVFDAGTLRLFADHARVGRHTERHRPVSQTLADPDAVLREWLRQWAKAHPRWGFRRAYHAACADGCYVNHKRLQRLWREEGLRVPQRRRRKRIGTSTTTHTLVADAPNWVWAVDFQFDATTDGRPVSLNERTASPVRSTVAS